jgi:copper(I)-binding protein
VNLSRTTATLLVGAFAVLLAACSGAAGSSEITVTDARVPVPPGANGAAYMTLTNDGDAADRLVGASTDAAETVELHETTTDGGTMSMHQVDGIDIPASGQAVLEPGGLHFMLIGVTQEFVEGETVDITLTFENADEQTVSAEVVPTGDMPEMDMGSEDDMDMSSEPMENSSNMDMASVG